MRIKCVVMTLFMLTMTGCGSPREQHYQGYVEGENTYLSSSNAGILVKKYVTRGQWVKKGALLFQLDANPEALVVKQNEAELLQAKKIYDDMVKPRRVPEIDAINEQIAAADANLQLARLRVGRTEKLLAKQAIDKDAVDEALARYEADEHLKAQYGANLALARLGSREEQVNAQQAQIEALMAKVEQAKWQLSQKSIYAPADGRIFDTYFVLGEFVPSQQPMAALLTPSHVRIQFFVPARALGELSVGETVYFSCEGCLKQNEASIDYISPEAEYIPPLVYSRENSDKLVFRVKATIQHAERFKPGEPVVVTVVQHG